MIIPCMVMNCRYSPGPMKEKVLGKANCSRISHDNTRATNPIESAVIEYWMAMTLRSEEHTSELQSRSDLVCRLLLEKKKKAHSNKMHLESNKYTLRESLFHTLLELIGTRRI